MTYPEWIAEQSEICTNCNHVLAAHWMDNCGGCSHPACFCSLMNALHVPEKCECGAAKLDASNGSPAHSRWCPVSA